MKRIKSNHANEVKPKHHKSKQIESNQIKSNRIEPKQIKTNQTKAIQNNRGGASPLSTKFLGNTTNEQNSREEQKKQAKQSRKAPGGGELHLLAQNFSGKHPTNKTVADRNKTSKTVAGHRKGDTSPYHEEIPGDPFCY